MIPDPRDQPTVPLWPVVGRALGLGKSLTYDLGARGGLPVTVLTCGRRKVVATAELRRVLHLDAPEREKAGPEAGSPVITPSIATLATRTTTT